MAKTLKIADLIERTNTFFEKSADSARMDRIVVQTFVTDILMDAKVYAGFGYLVPYGEPGSDSSRIFFYKSHKL